MCLRGLIKVKGCKLLNQSWEKRGMKHLMGLYAVMAVMVAVNWISEFIFKGDYSAIASWITVMLFLLGTIFFVNARYFLSKK